MLHASGVFYIYMVSGANFEFRKVVRKFLIPAFRANWVQNGKKVGFTKMSVES